MEYNCLGYRFRPCDEEIIMHFLELKMCGNDFQVRTINEVDICKMEPWELPDISAIPDDEEWFFFNKPTAKSANCRRTDRTTKAGSWKLTGKNLPIWDSCGQEIGFKKTLVFYKGRRSNAVKTGWVIHEYHSNNASGYENPFVLCRLKGNLDDKSQNYSHGESSRLATSGF